MVGTNLIFAYAIAINDWKICRVVYVLCCLQMVNWGTFRFKLLSPGDRSLKHFGFIPIFLTGWARHFFQKMKNVFLLIIYFSIIVLIKRNRLAIFPGGGSVFLFISRNLFFARRI